MGSGPNYPSNPATAGKELTMHEEQREQMLMQGYLQSLLNQQYIRVPSLGAGFLDKTQNLAEFSLVAANALYQISESQPDLKYPGVFWYEVPELLWEELVLILRHSPLEVLDYADADEWDAVLESWKEKVLSVFWTWIAAEGR